MKDIQELFTNQEDYPDLDREGAVRRLSQAVQCKTVSHCDSFYGEFGKLHTHIKTSYPCLMEACSFEVLGQCSLLLTLPGTNPALRPCLFMSHQDVVPVVEGTEKDWTYPAFSGAVVEGYIWGRGTLDVKEQVFGCLEALEYLLSHGRTFARTLYLAFGDDEETLNQGARTIAQTLKNRGITLEFVLDEGGGSIASGSLYGAPGIYLATVELMEKGYADLELSVQSAGGHSSRPFGGTSLGFLSQAIARIVEHPYPIRLPTAMAGAFKAVAPYVTEEPLRTLVQNVESNADAIAQYCAGTRGLFPYITTTIAPTIIRGGSSACNVMPQNMSAVINFRIAEGETAEQVFARCRSLTANLPVSMRFLQANDPSATARTDGFGYQKLLETMKRYFGGVVLIPSMTAGATDAHHYEIVCDTCLRCSPFMASAEETARGIHGTDERISIQAYLQGIRALIYLIEHTAS